MVMRADAVGLPDMPTTNSVAVKMLKGKMYLKFYYNVKVEQQFFPAHKYGWHSFLCALFILYVCKEFVCKYSRLLVLAVFFSLFSLFSDSRLSELQALLSMSST